MKQWKRESQLKDALQGRSSPSVTDNLSLLHLPPHPSPAQQSFVTLSQGSLSKKRKEKKIIPFHLVPTFQLSKITTEHIAFPHISGVCLGGS